MRDCVASDGLRVLASVFAISECPQALRVFGTFCEVGGGDSGAMRKQSNCDISTCIASWELHDEAKLLRKQMMSLLTVTTDDNSISVLQPKMKLL